MTTISLADAQSQLPTLVGQLGPQDEIVIVDGERPVARLLPAEEAAEKKPRRRLGTAKGILHIISDDDDHLKDFEEYMP